MSDVIIPHTTVKCYRLDPNKRSGNVDYLKFDNDFTFLNVKFYRNGWIKWNYTSTNLEDYNIKMKVSLAGLAGGGSISLDFWLDEIVPDNSLDINGYPTTYVKAPYRADTKQSIFHFASRDSVNGGLTETVNLLLEQQNPNQPRLAINTSRWFRIRFSYRASLMNQAFDGLLNGYRVVTYSDDVGLQHNYAVRSVDLPFIQIYVEKTQTALTDIDFAYLNIPTFADLDSTKQQTKVEILESISDPDSEYNLAISTLIEDYLVDNAALVYASVKDNVALDINASWETLSTDNSSNYTLVTSVINKERPIP